MIAFNPAWAPQDLNGQDIVSEKILPPKWQESALRLRQKFRQKLGKWQVFDTCRIVLVRLGSFSPARRWM